MAKLSKEELIAKVEGTSLSDEEKISFMEDLSDSFIEPDNSELDKVKAELEEKNKEYDELKDKYMSRFLSGDPGEGQEKKEEKEPEMVEKEYVVVKDIFTK